jgi:hypothetical protein
MQGRLQQAATKEKKRWFDSHPPDAERARRVAAAGYAGIIADPRPATSLFHRFPELSRNLTLAGYQLAPRRRPISPQQLFHVESPASSPDEVPDTSTQEAAIKRYFCGLGLVLKPLLLSPESRLGVGLASTALDKHRQAKARLEEADLLSYREALKTIDANMLQALEANALVQAGLPVPPESFPLLQNHTDLPALLNSLRGRQEQLALELEPFEQIARVRLLTALSLLRTPKVAAHIPNVPSLQDEIADLLHAFGRLSAAFPPLLELRKEFAVLQTLSNAGSPACSTTGLSESTERCARHISEIQTALGPTGLPFPHPKGRISIADYARAKKFDSDPARMAQLEAQSHLQLLFALYYQLLGRLVEIAVTVEAEIDMCPGLY